MAKNSNNNMNKRANQIASNLSNHSFQKSANVKIKKTRGNTRGR